MNDFEYVVFYSNHVIKTKVVNGEQTQINCIMLAHQFIIDEQIKAYKLDKDMFIDRMKEYESSYNLDALWNLITRLFSYLAVGPVITTEKKPVDYYFSFFTAMLKGLEVKSLEITGKLNGKTKKFTIIDDLFIEPVIYTLITLNGKAVEPERLKDDYTKVQFISEILPKRSLNYLLADELTKFFKEYLKKEELSGDDKELVMTILYAFNRYKEPQLSTDYNKLFSDAKINRFPTINYADNVIEVNGFLLNGSAIMDPDVLKIRDDLRSTFEKLKNKK
jgi:hypothetical protein